MYSYIQRRSLSRLIHNKIIECLGIYTYITTRNFEAVVKRFSQIKIIDALLWVKRQTEKQRLQRFSLSASLLKDYPDLIYYT